jgi:5,10-methylenetetrahydromethanopterin reductase
MSSTQLSSTQFFLFSRPSVSEIERIAIDAEACGFDGITLTDSQNLSVDLYVALTLAARATTRLRIGSGVTNPVTRHAAITAGAMASIHQLSRGRAVLGIGRGDSALFNIGLKPAPLKVFEPYVADVQCYLRGESIDKNGYPSKLHWLADNTLDKVPLDLAATGPRVIAIGARHAERVSFALGADVDRVRWALDQLRQATPAGRSVPSPGLYINVCVDDDIERAAEMVRGGVGIFAHFSGMPGAQHAPVAHENKAIFRDLGANYDKARHGRADAEHARRLPLDFIERFAIIGPAEQCRAKLQTLVDAGIERFFIIGPRADHYGEAAHRANARFAAEVMPAFHRL